eukprot:GHVR01091687.1.p1 GENE.GHVR01091687.1~~GHVR01091687.1.p1  ORF type:complete len:143 (-),score=58.04 GHVR01091687.1:125-553(-)
MKEKKEKEEEVESDRMKFEALQRRRERERKEIQRLPAQLDEAAKRREEIRRSWLARESQTETGGIGNIGDCASGKMDGTGGKMDDGEGGAHTHTHTHTHTLYLYLYPNHDSRLISPITMASVGPREDHMELSLHLLNHRRQK